MKLVSTSSNDSWSYPYNHQTNYNSMKKDPRFGEYSFNTCLPQPALIPTSLPAPIESTASSSSNRFP